MGTDLNAGIALDTEVWVPADSSVITQMQGIRWATINADTTAKAQMDGLGVVAEEAVERASLEENGGPVARTIHIREGNDFVNRRSLHDAVHADPEHDRRPERPYRIPLRC